MAIFRLTEANFLGETFTAIGSFATSAANGDIIQLIEAPAGTRVVDSKVVIKTSPGGTNNSTLHVGDGGSAGRFQAGVPVSAVGVFSMTPTATNYNYRFPARSTINVQVSAASAVDLDFDLVVTLVRDNREV